MMRDTDRASRVARLLAAALLAAACGGGGDGVVTPPPTPGALAVTVAADDGKPVEAASVSIQNSAGVTVGAGATDAAGAYQLTGLPAGTYTALVKVPTGFSPSSSQKQAAVTDGTTAAVAFAVQALRVDQATIGAGVTDSVALAAGLVAQVAVPAGAASVEVRLSQGPGSTLGGYDGVSPPATLQVSAPAAAMAAPGARAVAAGSVTVTVWNRVPTCAGTTAEMAFQVGAGSDGSPLFLYGESSCTTYSDPSTGQTGAAWATTSQVPVGSRLDLLLFTKDSRCTDVSRLAAWPSGAGDNTKTPVILIHGWQPEKVTCRQFRDWDPASTFTELEQSVGSSLGADYQVYVLRYPTMEPVANAVAYLRQEIVNRGWDKRDVVLVGHSMGGLVGRGYVAAYGSEYVRALVTLGTPHLGTPLAAGSVAKTAALQLCFPSFLGVAVDLYPHTDGYRDLNPGSDWIQALRDKRAGADRIYTFGGSSGIISSGYLLPFKCVLDAITLSTSDDGVVPLSSALPDWTTFQTTVEGSNHLGITGQTVAPVTNLLRQLSRCLPGTPPTPPGANGFPLSGTLARQADGRIDVVLNPIVVNGTPVRGLTKSAFTVVENACLKPFEITTSEGNLGVDLVFIQDLSGSMSGAIAGVRNSVLSFASALASRGLNVRMGSVGFSGPGTITTHANEGACEQVGPVQDLATPETFRGHVASSWYPWDGCDAPENALEAVKYAHEHMTWRSGSARVYILITDISMHTAADSCNGLGPCTDQTLESIVGLIGGTATVHAIAPSSAADRTYLGGLDPWLLAERTGGAKLVLPSNGVVDLNALGIADRVAEIVRLTFTSTSADRASHRIRIRVETGGKVAELSPGLARYDIDPSLRRPLRR